MWQNPFQFLGDCCIWIQKSRNNVIGQKNANKMIKWEQMTCPKNCKMPHLIPLSRNNRSFLTPIYVAQLYILDRYRRKETEIANKSRRFSEMWSYFGRSLLTYLILFTNLFYPVNNHGSILRELLQNFVVWKHVIPFTTKFIIPEEISNQLRSCILKNSSAAINYWGTL